MLFFFKYGTVKKIGNLTKNFVFLVSAKMNDEQYSVLRLAPLSSMTDSGYLCEGGRRVVENDETDRRKEDNDAPPLALNAVVRNVAVKNVH